MDFNEIFWRGEVWHKYQVTRFWWQSRSGYRSSIPGSR